MSHKKNRELRWLQRRYREAKKKEKSRLLDEVVERYSVSRRHAKRLLNPPKEAGGKPRQRQGRPSKYGDREFVDALRLIWRTTRFMCSRHLKASIEE